MDTPQEKPRYNKIRVIDDGINVDQKIFEQKLLKHDAYVQVSNGLVKISFRPTMRKNIANGSYIIQLPKDLLKYCWLYYDLPNFEIPKDGGLRVYIMFKVNGMEVKNI